MTGGEPKTSRPPSEWLLGLIGAGYGSTLSEILYFVECDGLGEPCSTYIDCKQPNTECYRGHCLCQDGFYEAEEGCKRKDTLNNDKQIPQ